VWDWLAGVGDLVAPVVDRLATRVLAAYIVRTDATGLTVLDPTSPAHVQRGSIWAMIGNDRDVLFRYTPSGEGASGPWAFLAGRTGYLQADACNVFDRLFTGQAASAVEFGCWSHGRRRLVALEGPDCRVAYPLKPIARLYRIEHLADARELTPEARRDLRHERAVPVLATLQRWFVATAQTEPPSTDLAKAVAYAVNFWVALTRFVEDGGPHVDHIAVRNGLHAPHHQGTSAGLADGRIQVPDGHRSSHERILEPAAAAREQQHDEGMPAEFLVR
jgi:transposase